MTNIGDKALFPCYIFNIQAKNLKNYNIKMLWIEDLPQVSGVYMDSTMVSLGTSFRSVRSSDYMGTNLFEQMLTGM